MLGDVPPPMNFTDLYNEHYGFLYFWVLKETRNKEIAEDICVAAFAKAFESFSELQDPAKFKPWLFTIAANETKRYWKRAKIRSCVPLDDCDEPCDPHDFISDLEKYHEIKRVHKALAMMSAIHRKAIKRCARGASCQGTWGSRLSHARNELRRLIAA